jgi:hypothetical protein
MSDLQNYVREASAVRTANFVLLSALLSDLAETKGAEGGKWLKQLRALAFEELNTTKLETSSDIYSADLKEVAEMARLLIETTFAMAQARRMKRVRR